MMILHNRAKPACCTSIAWAFIFSCLFSAVFRRWITPWLSQPLAVSCDAVAVIGIAYCYNRISVSLINVIGILIGVTCVSSAMTFGHHDLFVAIMGANIYFWFTPFTLNVSMDLDKKIALKAGKLMIYMLIPVVASTIWQFLTPQSSFINRGIGGSEEGVGFGAGEFGIARPAGIFSFTAALTDYYAICLSFLLYFLFTEDDVMCKREKLFFALSVIVYLISIPISISRTHLVQSLYVLGYCLIFGISGKKRIAMIGKFVLASLAIVCICAITRPLYWNTPFVQAFASRLTEANAVEGGLGNSMYNRTFGYAMRALEGGTIWGGGIGAYTNLGFNRLYGGFDHFNEIVADSTEMEWGRLVSECGVILGLIAIAFRITFAVYLIRVAAKAKRYGNDLPMYLSSFCVYGLAIMQLKTSYNIAFLFMGIMLLLASANGDVISKCSREAF